MKYRDVEYTIVQGLGRQIWKWSVKLDANRSAAGHAMTKAEAVSQAERAIDRSLRLRLVLPRDGGQTA
jgi:predicted ATPase